MSDYPPIPERRLSSAPSWMGGVRPPVSSINTTARAGGQLSWALLGVFAAGITVPCILTWLHNHGDLFPFGDQHEVGLWSLADLAGLEVLALIGCGPGALALTLLLFHFIRKSNRMESATERRAITLGAEVGAAMAFLNVPGYLSSEFYRDRDPVMTALRISLLFVVTGATCGAWIAWQAYRSRHPERGLFPRFSLFTLVGWVLVWGALLAVFMPLA